LAFHSQDLTIRPTYFDALSVVVSTKEAMKFNPMIEPGLYISDEDFLPNPTLTNFFEKYTPLRGDQISQHILKIVSASNSTNPFPTLQERGVG